MSFVPTQYSDTNTNLNLTDGTNKQRAEATLDLAGWVLSDYNENKSSAIATDGVNKQRVNVVYNLGAGSGGSGGGSGGTNNYNDLLNKPAIDGVTLTSRTTKADLGIDIDTSGFATEADIAAHNLSDQSHNDIRNQIVSINQSLNTKAEQGDIDGIESRLNSVVNTIANKADKVTISEDEHEVYKVAYIDEDGNYKSSLVNVGVFNSLPGTVAFKTGENTFVERNTFNKNLIIDVEDPKTSDESGIILGSNNAIVSGTNNKVILQDQKDEDGNQKTYLGGDKLEVYAPDEISIQTTTPIKIKRGNYTDGWNDYVNIDSGNINDYVSGSGGSSIEDKYGIEADYNTHYGILDCPNGLIDYSATNKEIEIQPGVVLQLAGANTKTTIASKTKYEIEETGKVVLFLVRTESEGGTVQTGFVEAGDVYYQEKEPTDGVTSFLAWWKPSLGLWQFKSIHTGNVWRTATATPIANINAGNTGITSINYIGYRIINDDIIAQMSDIEAIENKISIINSNISTLDTQVDDLYSSVSNKLSTISHDVTLEGDGTATSPLKLSQTIHKDLDDAIASVTELNAELMKKVDKDQGIENAGKFLKVGDDGNVELSEFETSGISSVSHDTSLSGSGTTEDPLKLAPSITMHLSTIDSNIDSLYEEVSNKIDSGNISDYKDTITDNCVHKTGTETINGDKTFNSTGGIKITNNTSNTPILKLSSTQGTTPFILERLNSNGTVKTDCVLEAGDTVGLFGTKSNSPLQIRTGYVTRATIGTDGSFVLAADIASDSNNNQVATTKWVNNEFIKKPIQAPLSQGTYTLQLVINEDGTRNLSWVAQ